MRRVLIAIGILLFPLGCALLLMFVALPDLVNMNEMPLVKTVLQSVLCSSDEFLMTQRRPSSRSGTTPTVSHVCIDRDEAQRDVTDQSIIVGVVALLVCEALGMAFIFAASRRQTKEHKRGS